MSLLTQIDEGWLQHIFLRVSPKSIWKSRYDVTLHRTIFHRKNTNQPMYLKKTYHIAQNVPFTVELCDEYRPGCEPTHHPYCGIFALLHWVYIIQTHYEFSSITPQGTDLDKTASLCRRRWVYYDVKMLDWNASFQIWMLYFSNIFQSQ